jgi:SAM-dependent methyltransferase
MTENRQAMADRAISRRSFGSFLQAKFRAGARRVAYATPLLRSYIEAAKATPESAARWNALMSDTAHATYLGGTLSVDSCNSLTGTFIKYRAASYPAVLDLGCCGGTLLNYLPPFARYLGLDISDYAIGEAERDADLARHLQSGKASFKAIDLREYSPLDRWDVVVFNEVLYYLTCDQAIAELKRYGRYLKSDGVLLVTMKDDAKSREIFRSINRSFEWIDGVLWQRKAFGPDYQMRTNRERPATLLGVFRLPLGGAENESAAARHRALHERLAPLDQLSSPTPTSIGSP